MDQTMKLLLLGMFYSSLFSYNRIIGVDGARKMSKEEIEIENEPKLLNKPYVKTIKTKYGEIFDCVDFYKQPAFDHPLLKNHTFYPEMKPSSIPRIRGGKKLSKKFSKSSFSRARCPLGTVPIRRTTKEDIIRAKSHFEKYGSEINSASEHPGYHYSIATTKLDSPKRYQAASTKIAVWNPPVMGSQYSSSRLKIQNGRNSIEFGWTVNPTLYGDNKTHIYTHANIGQSECFNAECSGFVVVDRDTTIGAIIDPVTQKGGDVTTMSILVTKYTDGDGNWWLQIGDDRRSIGFWPKDLFTDLSDFASSIEWGGEVFSPPNLPSPPMGSGEPTIRGKMRNEAFCKLMSTFEEGGEKFEDVTDLQLYNDDPDHYDIKDYSYRLPFLTAIVLFGGSGGATY